MHTDANKGHILEQLFSAFKRLETATEAVGNLRSKLVGKNLPPPVSPNLKGDPTSIPSTIDQLRALNDGLIRIASEIEVNLKMISEDF